MNDELRSLMKGLPMKVTDTKSATRLVEALGGTSSLLFLKKKLKQTIEHMQPEEYLYLIDWQTDFKMTHRDTGTTTSSIALGVVFFSNKRFFYYESPTTIIEFPLDEISSVAAYKGVIWSGVSFRSKSLDLEIRFQWVGKKKIHVIRDMIIYLSAHTIGHCVQPDKYEQAEYAKVVNCSGCNATVIIHKGTAGVCDYCNNYVSYQETVIPHVSVPVQESSIADELQKYKTLLDTGAISAMEYEEVKDKLLSKL